MMPKIGAIRMRNMNCFMNISNRWFKKWYETESDTLANAKRYKYTMTQKYNT